MRPLPLLRAAVLAGALLAAILPGAGVTAAACAPSLSPAATGSGEPDDLAFDGRMLLFTDELSGALMEEAELGGKVHVVATGLRAPEGIVPLGDGTAIVAEQGRNRLVRVNIRSGTIRQYLALTNRTKNDGVDGIGRAANGDLLIPDSPNGRLLRLDRSRRPHTIVGGLGRPVGVVPFRKGFAVADETANAVWLVRGGRTTRLATVSIPDDVVVRKGKLLAVTLGDHALWEIWPVKRLITNDLVSPQGLALAPDGKTTVVADSKRNVIYRVNGLDACTR